MSNRKIFNNEEIAGFLDKLEVGIYVANSHGDLLYVNDALVTITGISKESIIGINVFETITHNFSVLKMVLEEKKCISAFQDIDNKFSNKHYRQLITCTPIFDEKSEIKYIVAMIEKVEELEKRLENASKIEIVNSNLPIAMRDTRNKKIIAESPKIKAIMELIERIALVDSSVLIEGESGTGKEVIAHAIHDSGSRYMNKLIEINCAALPEQLLEAELFGYEKGSFTGALNTGKKGLIEEAEGGTLFLDEINSLPYSIQGKLLRVLETKQVRRVGSTTEKNVDFRLVSATNESLLNLCEAGKFRNDLYYRICIIPIKVPPLCERKEDIIPLANMFLEEITKLYGRFTKFAPTALQQLLEYEWPGNVRELRNLIERTIVSSESGVVEIQKISETMFRNNGFKTQKTTKKEYLLDKLKDLEIEPLEYVKSFSLDEYMNQSEVRVLQKLAENCRTTIEMSKILKIDRTSVARKLKKYGIKLNK